MSKLDEHPDVDPSDDGIIQLHYESETVEHYENQYKICTRAYYDIEADEYLCKTLLKRVFECERPSEFKSPKTRTTLTHRTTERNLVESRLQSHVRECKDMIRYIDERTDVDIEVDI